MPFKLGTLERLKETDISCRRMVILKVERKGNACKGLT